MEHADSHGHRGAIRSGDVQWMTAGSGVVHSEMPSRAMMERGGRMHGFQIWVNLPREKKMTAPRYQEYAGAQLPVFQREGVWARVIAGTYGDARSPIETTVPTTMVHVKLQPHARGEFELPKGANAIVYAIEGAAGFDRYDLRKREVALVSDAPERLTLAAGEHGFEALVFAGMPLNEPVARYGPFVMNTRRELEQAFEDYRAGRFTSSAAAPAAPLR